MGKRKARVDKHKASSHPDIILHARQVDLQSKQAVRMDAPDISLKRSPGCESPHWNHGSTHSLLSRHPHYHPFGRRYSRRSSYNYSDASPSNWKGSPLYDTKLSFKPESKDLLAFPYRGSRIFQQPERIRSCSFGGTSESEDCGEIECRICHESSLSVYSVVAVLVCGHVYHADCLEQETSHEDCQDPPCPLCVNQA